jgi:hypothetical protein
MSAPREKSALQESGCSPFEAADFTLLISDLD